MVLFLLYGRGFVYCPYFLHWNSCHLLIYKVILSQPDTVNQSGIGGKKYYIMKRKQQTDYTLLAIAIPFFIACAGSFPGCYNSSTVTPKRHLLEIGYNTKTKDVGKDLQRVTGYTIDAIYLDGKDTISVKGLTQAQYDSLNISE